MARLPRNIGQFGIAGLGALGKQPMPLPVNAAGGCPAGYQLNYAGTRSAICNPKFGDPTTVNAWSAPTFTTGFTPSAPSPLMTNITDQVKASLPKVGTCPPGMVKKYSGMGGKGQEPPYTCVPASSVPATTPLLIKPTSVVITPQPTTSAGATSITASPVKLGVLLAAGVGAAALLLLTLRRA